MDAELLASNATLGSQEQARAVLGGSGTDAQQALEQLQKQYQHLLNMLDSGAFTLSRHYHVLGVNPRAQALLKQGSHFKIYQNCLRVVGPRAAHFDELLKRVVSSGIAESMEIRPFEAADSAYITVSRLPEVSAKTLQEQPILVVQFTQANHLRIASVQQLIQLFNFSPAEARLARAMASGSDLEAYALEQGVKVSTLRTQIKAMFHKARVHRQTDLVRLVIAVPACR